MQMFSSNLNVRGGTSSAYMRPRPCARAAGKNATKTIYYEEIFATDSKRLDTSIWIFQMQMTQSVVLNEYKSVINTFSSTNEGRLWKPMPYAFT